MGLDKKIALALIAGLIVVFSSAVLGWGSSRLMRDGSIRFSRVYFGAGP